MISTSRIIEFVGLDSNNEIAQCVKVFKVVSERVVLIQMKTTPVDINIIQIYAPMLNKEEEEVENMNTPLNNLLKELRKHDIAIVTDDSELKPRMVQSKN